jgi:hypothetical protein
MAYCSNCGKGLPEGAKFCLEFHHWSGQRWQRKYRTNTQAGNGWFTYLLNLWKSDI